MQQLRVPDQQLMVGSSTPKVVALLVDGDGDEAAGLTVTVDVARADGTILETGIAATEGTDELAGTYSAPLSDADVSELDLLTATWKVGAVVKAMTLTEIVGGFYFTPRELRVDQPTITAQKADDSAVKRLRSDVEAEFEQITRAAFVPRYARVRLTHNHRGGDPARLLVPHQQIRTVRSIRFYDDVTTFTTLDPSVVDVSDIGVLTRLDGGWWPGSTTDVWWPWGRENIVLEYEYGYDGPPRDVRSAAMIRLRELSSRPVSALPDRAISFQVSEGGTFRLSTPSADRTGNPDVDAVLDRWQNKGLTIGIA